MAITLNQHKEAITKRIIATFEDIQTPKMGLGALFTDETSPEKMLGVEVRRGRQLIAADIVRGTDANLNTFDRYNEKLYTPPYYQEGFNFVDLDRYNVTFGRNTNPSEIDSLNMINSANAKLEKLKYKIMRSIERQRAQVLQTGIVTLNNNDNISYRRQADSLVVNGAPARWDVSTGVPLTDLETGAQFLREQGLSMGTTVTCIMGRDAFRAFMNNQQVTNQADNRRIRRVEIDMPEMRREGMAFQGMIAVYDFNVMIWTYSDFFETDAGVKTSYIDDNKVIMVAEDFEAKTGYASVPAIVRDRNNAEYPEFISMVESDFYVNNYILPRQKAHMFEIASAPLAIPVSIDRIWTAQVLA
jgi:hypothetical protein